MENQYFLGGGREIILLQSLNLNQTKTSSGLSQRKFSNPTSTAEAHKNEFLVLCKLFIFWKLLHILSYQQL
jgi:hypothetical protein